MEAITYQNIKIEGTPIRKITSLEITNGINNYGTARLTGEVQIADGDSFVNRADETTCVTIGTSAEGQPSVLFVGLVETASISKYADYAILSIVLRATASRLNLRKENRSFQNTASTYGEIINKVLDGKATLRMNVTDKPIGRLVMQYNETPWEFTMRMASEFGAPLSCNVDTELPELTIGVPKTGNSYDLSDVEYEFADAGLKDVSVQGDMSSSGIAARQFVMLGDSISYGGQTQQVQRYSATLRDGILTDCVGIASGSGFTQAPIANKQVSGKMFLGEVKAVQKDQVQVHLVDIDNEYDSGGNLWLPYSTAYSSGDGSGFYCMPQEGDKVRVFFPSDNEKDAFAASSVNVSPLDNPLHKKWRSPAGKEILLTEGGIFITCKDQKIFINLEDDAGISICADKDINICSNNNILVYAQNYLKIQSEEKILLSTGSSYIDMTKSSIEMGASNVVIK